MDKRRGGEEGRGIEEETCTRKTNKQNKIGKKIIRDEIKERKGNKKEKKGSNERAKKKHERERRRK